MKIIVSLLYVVEMCIALYALMIYTSAFKSVSWYESSGMQFLIIFVILVPMLIVLGITLLIIKNWVLIPKLNLILPWIIICTIALPVINGTLQPRQLHIGIIVTSIISILSGVYNFRHLIALFKV